MEKTILILDDSRMMWSFYRMLLQSFGGLDLHFAETAMEAWSLLNQLSAEKRQIDMIIADINCPGIRGEEGGLDLAAMILQDKSFHQDSLTLLLMAEEDAPAPGAPHPGLKIEVLVKRHYLKASNQSALVDTVRRHLEGGVLHDGPIHQPRPLRALVVEDDPASGTVMMRYLERAGIQVTLAKTGQDALDLACQVAPDIILMDVGLPDLGGLEVTRALKNNPETRGIPVVAVSARVMEEDRRLGLEAGMAGYHAKPVDFALLIQAIEKIARPRA